MGSMIPLYISKEAELTLCRVADVEAGLSLLFFGKGNKELPLVYLFINSQEPSHSLIPASAGSPATVSVGPRFPLASSQASPEGSWSPSN